jgi:allantoin racemase
MGHRIANLVGEPAKDWGFEVPDWAVSPGFVSEVVLVPILPLSPLNELEATMAELVYAEAGIAALEEGYEAVVINTVDDCGLRYMRAAVSAPVVGCGQASMQVAMGLGKRFAIVTVFPPALLPQYQRLVHGYGFDEQCAGVWFASREDENVTPGGTAVHELRAGGGGLLERVREQARAAAAAGAESIVLGCTCMSPARDLIAESLPIPVIDPVAAGHKMAEMLVSMRISHAGGPVPFSARETFRSMVHGTGPLADSFDQPVDEVCGDACEDLREESRDEVGVYRSAMGGVSRARA